MSIQLVESPEQIDFQTEAEFQIKQLYREIETFSLDNFSDTTMVTHAQALVKQADHILILTESKSDRASLNKLLKFFNTLVREKLSNGKLILLGENQWVEKMAKALEENFGLRPTEKELLDIAHKLLS